MTRFAPHMTMARAAQAAFILAALSTAGCISQRADTNGNGTGVEFDGIVNGFMDVGGLGEFNGNILDAGLFGSASGDDIASFDIWPIGGVGVGVAGAHVRVLPLEIGFGTLFHDPVPFRSGYHGDLEEELEELDELAHGNDHDGDDHDEDDQEGDDD